MRQKNPGFHLSGGNLATHPRRKKQFGKCANRRWKKNSSFISNEDGYGFVINLKKPSIYLIKFEDADKRKNIGNIALQQALF